MAKKKETSTDKPEFAGFANLELSKEEKADMMVWIADSDEVGLAIEQFIASGHKLSITYNEANKAYQASAICNYPKSPNAGWVLSAFAPDWYSALACLCFKHFVIAKSGTWRPDKPLVQSDLFG